MKAKDKAAGKPTPKGPKKGGAKQLDKQSEKQSDQQSDKQSKKGGPKQSAKPVSKTYVKSPDKGTSKKEVKDTPPKQNVKKRQSVKRKAHSESDEGKDTETDDGQRENVTIDQGDDGVGVVEGGSDDAVEPRKKTKTHKKAEKKTAERGKGGSNKKPMSGRAKKAFEKAQGITEMRAEKAAAAAAEQDDDEDDDVIVERVVDDTLSSVSDMMSDDSHKQGKKGSKKKTGSSKVRFSNTGAGKGKSAQLPSQDVEDSDEDEPKEKRPAVRLSNELQDNAIEFIEVNPLMWDTGDDEWKNEKKKKELWDKLAKMCSKTVEEMKRWWKNNRDEFNRMHARYEQSGAGALKLRSALARWRWQKVQFYTRSSYHRYKKTDPLVSIPLKKRRAAQPHVMSSNSSDDEEPEGDGDVEDEGDDVASQEVGAARVGNVAAPVTRAAKKRGTITEQLLTQLKLFMARCEARQDALLKPSTVKEGYGHYISSWIRSLNDEHFKKVRQHFDEFIRKFEVSNIAGPSLGTSQQSEDILRQAA